ncbi:hypothetical protein, partial [Anaerorhabdus sp.]
PNISVENYIEMLTGRTIDQIDKAIVSSCKSIINDNEVIKLAASIIIHKQMELISTQELLNQWVNLNLTSVTEITNFYKNNTMGE